MFLGFHSSAYQGITGNAPYAPGNAATEKPDEVFLLGQTEKYVEYDRAGRVVKVVAPHLLCSAAQQNVSDCRADNCGKRMNRITRAKSRRPCRSTRRTYTSTTTQLCGDPGGRTASGALLAASPWSRTATALAPLALR